MFQTDQLIEAFDSRAKRREDRRDFFKSALGAAAATAAGATALTVAGNAAAQTTAVTEADILNFALNLEYLEAQFYSVAALGTPLAANLLTGTGAQGAVTGGRQVNFTDPVVARYAREIAQDEIAHVAFLRTALGSAAVAQPAIDIGVTATSAFSNAARAAGLIGAGAAFDVYATDENFLLGAFVFEDVGVSAYKGAAKDLVNNKTFLEAAAGILAVEAYHAAIVRTTLYSKGIATPALRTSADAISNARDTLDGGSDIDQGISPVNVTTSSLASPQAVMTSNIVLTDNNGIAFGRTAGQVLNIVYLTKAAVAVGGFFPAGLNGTIKTATAQA